MHKILLIEDDARLANLVQSFLQQHGFTVELCDNGLQAEALCRQSQPDLVVLDLMLPGMDGFAVCRALRGDPSVVTLHTTNGRWDLIAELRADSLEAFDAVLNHIRRIKGIANTETSILLSTHKI